MNLELLKPYIKICYCFILLFFSGQLIAQTDKPLELELIWQSNNGLESIQNKNSWLYKQLNKTTSPSKPLCLEDDIFLQRPISLKPSKLYKSTIYLSEIQQQYVVFTEDIIAESITVFFQHRNCWNAKSFGRTLSKHEGFKSSPYPNVIINISAESDDIFLLHQDNKSIRPWVDILSNDEFIQKNNTTLILLGHYSGIYLVLVIAGFLMFLWQKTRLTLFYFLYALACLFYGSQVSGLGSINFTFWPNFEYFKLMQVLAVSFIIAGIALVTFEFLQIKGRINNILKTGVFLTCFSFILSYWVPNSYYVGAVILLPVALMTFLILAKNLKRGETAIKWFSLGLMASVIGGGVQAFSIISGGSGVNGLASFAFILGSLFESAVWLFAIALRLRQDRRKIEERLIYEATHDVLTQFGNRTHLTKQLEKFVQDIKIDTSLKKSLLFIDLDRFKYVNDSLGHSFGDKILIKASKLMNQLAQTSEVFRFAGDKFVIVLNENFTQQLAINLANDICYSIENNLNIDGINLHISTTTGIVMIDNSYKNADEIMRDADIALYHAKRKSIGRFCVYEPSMHEVIYNRFSIEHEISTAINDDQFEMYYQPIVDICNGKTIGFESLVRWNHPTKGFVRPDEFIPIAEETGQIVQLGSWILTEVIRQVGEWKYSKSWPENFYVTINVSGVQLSDENLLQLFKKHLQFQGVKGTDIKIELTETAVISNQHIADNILPELNALGIKLCMDDFGTGYSSLTYLNEMNFDVLKIDRSFITDIGHKESSKTLVRTVMAMAKEMKMLVVAEGIEESNQVDVLQGLNCKYGQGYYYAKPMQHLDAKKLLETIRDFGVV